MSTPPIVGSALLDEVALGPVCPHLLPDVAHPQQPYPEREEHGARDHRHDDGQEDLVRRVLCRV